MDIKVLILILGVLLSGCNQAQGSEGERPFVYDGNGGYCPSTYVFYVETEERHEAKSESMGGGVGEQPGEVL
jgi:hypothetical protein